VIAVGWGVDTDWTSSWMQTTQQTARPEPKGDRLSEAGRGTRGLDAASRSNCKKDEVIEH